jgi:hypothetical protein
MSPAVLVGPDGPELPDTPVVEVVYQISGHEG